MTRRPLPLKLVLALAMAVAVSARAQESGDARLSRIHTEDAVIGAFEAGEYDRAADLLEHWVRTAGPDPTMLYNLACARSRLGQIALANDALLRAVKAGFRNFAHMETDPDLEALRANPVYGEIVRATNRLRRSAPDPVARWRRDFGDRDYRYERDEARNLVFATALDAVSNREMRSMLERQADHLAETLFGAFPTYEVLVAVPSPRDADRLFGGEANIGGRYEHDARRLISRDIGGSLRHEFVHLMHYGHMERLGLRTPHPLWLQEGLAALYEDYELGPDGSITFLQNERHNVVANRARRNRLTSWSTLFAMSADRFMDGATRNYPQARSIFEFLAERGKLPEWYHAYVDNFDRDTTGALAFEIVFRQTLEEVEEDWRDWVLRRPGVDNRIAPGDASIGVTSGSNTSNDGVLIEEVLPGSAASRARLRPGDVIVAIDGRETRSLLELQKLIGSRRVGDRVMVRVRRGVRYLTVELVLRPR